LVDLLENKKNVHHFTHPILLFDGVCNLCNAAVDFVLKHEANSQIRFASIQSDIGQAFLNKFGKDSKRLESSYFIENDQIFEKVVAALLVAQYLKSPWKYLKLIKVLPLGLLNFVYDIIAKYRYKFFGKRETCRMPTLAEKNRFLG
jgi:predicted DCC family thiol-disulfide oxidoreductase YuxK